MLQKISLISINSDIHSIRLFSLAKHTILSLIVTRQPPLSLHVYPHGMPAYTDGERPVCTDMGTAAYRWQKEDFSRGASSSDGGNETPCRVYAKYWCPVNLYERPYKRRGLGNRIEGVAQTGCRGKKKTRRGRKFPRRGRKFPRRPVSTARHPAENRCYVNSSINQTQT